MTNDDVIFGDGKTVAEKTDAELTELLRYWGYKTGGKTVATAIREEIARRKENAR